MLSLLTIILMILKVIWYIVIAHVIMSWLINFQVLNLRQPLVAQIWDGLNRILNPIYSRIRRFLPDMGGLDLSPMIVLLGIYAIQIVIANNMPAFY
ncbi:MAG: YggT family protein [Rhodobacter sp.]|nr:YggT family protein [Paracoccaceae bacterium]MCB1408307.1 YggT family protein [Paracoccaceae bacterium]MCC0079514.1 YggT family protein [Rhodobacter sp.]